MEKPLISVIIPAYNAEKYIKRCINSILSQTYENIEAIVIDDGSEDNTFAICDNISKEDSRLVLIHQENQGVSAARNNGLSFAKGTFIGFVDADDYIEKDMYNKLYSSLVSSNADISCCGYRQEYSDFHYDIACEKETLLETAENILAYYFRQDIRTGIGDGNWNKLFSKKVLSDIKYSEIANGEDVEYQYNAFLRCFRLICIPDILYHYVANDFSASNSEFTEKQGSIIDISRKISDDAISKYPNIRQQAKAFDLTWNISLLQKVYNSSPSVVGNIYELRIIDYLKKSRKDFSRNKYSKRLDQYYLNAAVFGMMKPAMRFRTMVRKIKPSKDVKK